MVLVGGGVKRCGKDERERRIERLSWEVREGKW